ncbi:MAG: YwiC-like family protein [Actinomycetota bacterium]|nr:YwiC-like family protein [Actinomycetota bacterium]
MSSYLPPQHGAWAFLVLPLVLGVVLAPWTPLLVVLAVAWVAAYPLSYALLGLARARRSQRFRRPLVAWSAVVLPAVVVLVAARPWLVWVGLVYAAAFTVNLRHARRNDERALANDAVFVAECTAMVVLTWAVAAGTRSWAPPGLDTVPAHVWILTVVCALVLMGSTLHVKSLIRERRDPRFARVSRLLAVVSVPASLALAVWWGLPQGTWLVLPFVVLAVRAFVVGRRPTRPGVIGMVELGAFVLAAVSAALAAA